MKEKMAGLYLTKSNSEFLAYSLFQLTKAPQTMTSIQNREFSLKTNFQNLQKIFGNFFLK